MNAAGSQPHRGACRGGGQGRCHLARADGTATDVWCRARFPVEYREPRLLRGHNSNRLERNGMVRDDPREPAGTNGLHRVLDVEPTSCGTIGARSRMRWPATTSWVGSAALCCDEESSDTSFEFCEREFAHRGFSAKEQQTLWHFGGRENGPQSPTKPVPFHRRACGTAERKCDLGRREPVIIDEGTPQRALLDPGAFATESNEGVTLSNPIDHTDRSGGESSAALVATRLQHSPTSASAHPCTETVLAVAATIVGLECALHDDLFRRFKTDFGSMWSELSGVTRVTADL